ncbi:MAG: 3-deoxy-manno-octulosonate cytidylyltransferase [Lentisphaerae bacterium]|nr:3-deoxy-manno-octulosonate cytidylyltransferase [Lentisphaerota bacterium]
MSNKRTAVVIPARYASTRFPGKVLAMLAGKPMIQHVFERASASKADICLIAADDQRVIDACKAFGATAVMTDPELPSGTDRIAAALKDIDADVVINVQGDEPLLPTEAINSLIDRMLEADSPEMATIGVQGTREELDNPNKVKLVKSNSGKALYFSRSMIPFLRTGGEDMPVYLHWGIYAYRRDVLEKFVTMDAGKLENCEKLEQLRALENDIATQVLITDLESVGVDTPEDLVRAEAKLAEKLKNM